MSKPDLKNVASTGKPALVTPIEKAKVLAFVNWTINGADGKPVLRSNRGFSIMDSEKYPMSLEEKALLQLATDNGGTAIIANVEFRVVLHAEKPESLDTSGVVLKKAA